jgi:hypothetical protein
MTEATLASQSGQLSLPMDYDRIFSDRMVFLTGMSRSGTSIVSKIVGSLDHVMYLHEPILLRYIPPLISLGKLDVTLGAQMLKGLLFEDYFLQVLHGRNLNLKEDEKSFFGHYDTMESVQARWEQFPRRNDVLAELRGDTGYRFAMKTGEVGPILSTLRHIMPGLRVIHIIRDGNEIISSSIRRGWYTDAYLNADGSQWTQRGGSVNVPWFVPEDMVEKFGQWNVETRIAYLWRTITESTSACHDNVERYMEIRYEDLLAKPDEVLERCEQFIDAQRTPLTLQHVQAVKEHQLTAHKDHRSQIAPEEREPFRRAMEDLGYAG